jgi:hypothetical protein
MVSNQTTGSLAMPACNIFNERHQQLLIKFFDTVTADDLEEQAKLLASNKTVGSARRKCISFLSATGFGPGITLEKIRSVVAIMRASIKQGREYRTAFVAPGEEALGISLMFKECLAIDDSQAAVRIFTTKEEAVDWLGGGRAQWKQMRDHVSKMCSL